LQINALNDFKVGDVDNLECLIARAGCANPRLVGGDAGCCDGTAMSFISLYVFDAELHFLPEFQNAIG
jgi:hypothetical protein